MNKAQIIGRVGRDPETKTFPSGGKVCNFSVATSERWTKDGERQERTTWHNVAIFNEKLADVAQRFLRKGSKVYVEGQIETREYEQNGAKRTATEIVLRPYRGEIELLDSKGDGEAAPAPQGKAASSALPDDEVPF